MILRNALYPVRLLLLIICVQFTVFAAIAKPLTTVEYEESAFMPVEKSGNPLSASSLFEQTETEGGGKRHKFHAIEIEDISISCYYRSETFLSRCFNDRIVLHRHQQLLFRLHHVFLI
jgi:hypothetical protein